MSAALVHRGPDDAGTHVEGPVGLAARRLSIIDLAHGHQPITVPGGITVSQNGEVYDHAQHRDRKSTRLNSSHANISYAVFCLKKKNPVTQISRLTSSACNKQ